jgi:hypothetical protein
MQRHNLDRCIGIRVRPRASRHWRNDWDIEPGFIARPAPRAIRPAGLNMASVGAAGSVTLIVLASATTCPPSEMVNPDGMDFW